MACHNRQFSTPAFEPALLRSDRKLRGVYYTPPEIVRQIVELTIAPLLSQNNGCSQLIRILDPSCGAGEFLTASYQRLSESLGMEAACKGIWGIDTDGLAVQTARSRLLALDAKFSTKQIVVGDALRMPHLMGGSFDVIVGNPPYVNIRQLAKTLSGDQITSLRRTYTTARGNFDLYVLFIERAIELLRPGGRCGLIIPGKWATLDYARECRKLLLSQTTIEQVIDMSEPRVFAAASVYPHILIFTKAAAKSSHLVEVGSFLNHKNLRVPQTRFSEHAIQLAAPLDVELQVPTASLGSLAVISCGTAGYSAQKVARLIFEVSDAAPLSNDPAADFVTSGNIDRYAIRLGNVRYLNRHFARPKLPLTAHELTVAKRRLFESPKIVVAGMSRRLEAAWDDTGLALGVQVYAIHQSQLDPFYLLALLNSKLLSFLFATRFAAKRLGGGYFAINKGQLVDLPIRVSAKGSRADDRSFRRLAQLSRDWSISHDAMIDRLIYKLYRLSDTEIARVERHFAEPTVRAA